MPCWLKNCLKAVEVYSLPLSDWRYLILVSNKFSTSNLIIQERTSLLLIKGYSQENWLYSSTNTTYYLHPLKDGTGEVHAFE
jgi:hypothetical protein